MINADQALKACKDLAFESVLDIGSGDGVHSALFESMGKEVHSIDLARGIDYMDTNYGKFDLVWCSHVLEHQPNVNAFLKKITTNLHIGGYLVITVPPLKNEIVGGHLTMWNAGLLLYNLILAGFDCSKARVKTYGYNISVIVKYIPANLPKLSMDFGDIEKLAHYFPMSVKNGFNGIIEELNW